MVFNSSIENEIKDTSMKHPHVVILGAGASLAAFPNGDKYGTKLPLMNNLVDTLDLRSILESNNIKYDENNFEETYSDLYDKAEHKNLLRTIEKKIYEYFLKLELPDYPTIYDHLVLSLRNKDLIATFNWDPFLWQACLRNHQYVRLPQTVFLHGNIAVGYCLEHKIKGSVGGTCRKCGKKFMLTKLLYPIQKKNYNNDPYISAEWKTLRNYLEHAYILTIFGYSAPQSDVEAIQIMKEAWGNIEDRNLEQVEIIDIKGEDELWETWVPFIHTHHGQVCNDFYDSWVAKHPRRSCDAMWNSKMEIQDIKDNSIPKNSNFEELWNWFKPFKSFE